MQVFLPFSTYLQRCARGHQAVWPFPVSSLLLYTRISHCSMESDHYCFDVRYGSLNRCIDCLSAHISILGPKHAKLEVYWLLRVLVFQCFLQYCKWYSCCGITTLRTAATGLTTRTESRCHGHLCCWRIVSALSWNLIRRGLLLTIHRSACITSIIRLYRMSVLLSRSNFSYDGADIAMWSAAELNTAIVCACMPSLKPVCRRLIPGGFLSSWHSINTTQNTDARRMDHVKRLGNMTVDSTLKAIDV